VYCAPKNSRFGLLTGGEKVGSTVTEHVLLRRYQSFPPETP